MRGIVGLFIVGVIGIAGFFVMMKDMNREPGPNFLVAFGEPADGVMEVNVCMPIAIRKIEVPPEGGLPRVLDPQEWTEAHWELTDSTGDPRALSAINGSRLVNDTKAGGAPDFWIKTSAKVGDSYTLSYRPDLQDSKRYQFKFDAVEGIKERQRVEFVEMK